METKGLVQGMVVDEDREQGEDIEEMGLQTVNNNSVITKLSAYL